MNSPWNRTVSAKRPLTQRSAVTNGKTLIAGIDGRSAWMRRFRDLFEAHVSDLGGEGEISEAEKSIARRAATLAVECERMEALFATAGAATADELDLYGRTANSLRRLLESTGLKRRPKDVTPTLTEFLADHARQKVVHATAEPVVPISPPPNDSTLPPPPPISVNN
jgi:hypothetical protein